MKVYLDPGHGGTDPGAVANGVEEKAPNLAVGLIVRDMLRARGIEALMSRVSNDVAVSLPARTTEANQAKADAFVSIHHNAAADSAVRGVEIYHSILGGEGKRLAGLIHDRYRTLIPELPSRGLRTRTLSDGSGRDYYHVIRETAMPAVIVEGCFLTNAQDAALAVTLDFQHRQAMAIAQGILQWYGLDIGVPAETPTGTLILGSPRATVEQARAWARSRGAHQRFMNIVPVYWKYGNIFGIRPEIMYCQAAKETAFGQYGGAVKPEMNNWAGIKTAKASGDRPEDHETFASPEDGVLGHYNHMAAYLGLVPLGEPHGRYYVVRALPWAGTVKTVEELGGKWAPNPDYGKSIVRDYLEGLLATKAPSAVAPPPPVNIEALEARVRELEDMIWKIRHIVM